MKLEFKPEMFTLMTGESTDSERSAKEANEIFNKWLKDATVVYGHEHNGQMHFFTDPDKATDTHKALLINIESIVKESCKHEPYPESHVDKANFCKHCGVELIAEWKAK